MRADQRMTLEIFTAPEVALRVHIVEYLHIGSGKRIRVITTLIKETFFLFKRL